MNQWKAKWLPVLISILPVFFPLYLFRANWFGLPVNMIEVIILVVFILFVLTEKLWEPKWWARYASEWKLWPVALFILAALVSTIFVQEGVTFIDGTPFEASARALGILKGWVLIPILYFVMARHTFRERPSMILLSLDALILGGAVLSLMAIQQEISGTFLTLDGRASGPFESANYLSLYLGPMVVYGVLETLHGHDWGFRRSFRLLLTLISLLGLYFTESYAAWLAVLAALFLWLCLSFKSFSKKWQRGLFVLLGFVFVLGILSQLGSDKFQQFFELTERSSSSVRLQVYEISMHLIAQHPLFGLGLGAFEWAYQDQAVAVLGEAPFEWVMLHPHNIFLAMWLNMGLLGLIAFLWLVIKGLAWLFESDNKGYRTAAFMLVALLIHGLFDTPYFKNDLAFEFWLLMAVLI